MISCDLGKGKAVMHRVEGRMLAATAFHSLLSARIRQLDGWQFVLNLSLKCLPALGIVESKQSASSLLYNDAILIASEVF